MLIGSPQKSEKERKQTGHLNTNFRQAFLPRRRRVPHLEAEAWVYVCILVSGACYFAIIGIEKEKSKATFLWCFPQRETFFKASLYKEN